MTSEQQMLDLELPQRYRPNTISGLCEATGWEDWRLLWPDIENWPVSTAVKNIHSSFSATEIKRLYWSFKSECPSGLVNQETFHEIYSKFFPVGGKPHIHIRISLCPCSRSSFPLLCRACKKPSKISQWQSRRRPLLALSHWSHLHYAKQAPKHGN